MGARKIGKYRSGLETIIGRAIERRGFKYESVKLKYTSPAQKRTYLPDWTKDDLVVEAKGRFTSADRKKILLVKEQHPNKKIILIFGKSKNKLSRRSSTTYADWCDQHDILWIDIEDFPKAFYEVLNADSV